MLQKLPEHLLGGRLTQGVGKREARWTLWANGGIYFTAPSVVVGVLKRERLNVLI